MKRLATALMIGLLQCVAPALLAAEPETPAAAAVADAAADTTAEAAPATTASTETAEEDATPGTMAADDTFVPTVEISEDLSVSFPSDI